MSPISYRSINASRAELLLVKNRGIQVPRVPKTIGEHLRPFWAFATAPAQATLTPRRQSEAPRRFREGRKRGGAIQPEA